MEWIVEAESLSDFVDYGRYTIYTKPLIRCRDCKYGVDYYHEGDCYCSNPKWGLKYFGGSWKFYCADAERKEDADN